MGRQVPAVERALEIFELLAERSQEQLGLSDIARALTMNKASCFATLTMLSERGYLIRHADKTYSLGPAILPLATSFLRDHDALACARVEMAALSRELNLDCIASGVVDDEIVVLENTLSPGSFGVSVKVGTRFALVPPIGTVFLAWAAHDRVRRWLDAVGQDDGDPQRARLLDALAVVRDRGYSVALGQAGATREVDDYLLFELDEAQRLPITHIAAPVFDPEGSVRLAVTLVGFHERLSSRDVPAVAKQLLAAAGRIAGSTWGGPLSTS